jgi:hypothetical protein
MYNSVFYPFAMREPMVRNVYPAYFYEKDEELIDNKKMHTS